MSLAEFGAMATEAAEDHGIDPDLYHRLINQESRWNPDAVSPAGAFGLTQFMPPTANEWNVRRDSPESQIKGGAKYLSYLRDYFKGDMRKATAAYNWGMGNVQKKGLTRMPEETRNYVNTVLGPTSPGIPAARPQLFQPMGAAPQPGIIEATMGPGGGQYEPTPEPVAQQQMQAQAQQPELPQPSQGEDPLWDRMQEMMRPDPAPHMPGWVMAMQAAAPMLTAASGNPQGAQAMIQQQMLMMQGMREERRAKKDAKNDMLKMYLLAKRPEKDSRTETERAADMMLNDPAGYARFLKVQEDTRAPTEARRPTTRMDQAGNLLQLNEETNEWMFMPTSARQEPMTLGETVAMKAKADYDYGPLTEAERRAAAFYSRMSDSGAMLGDMDTPGDWSILLKNNVPLIGNYLINDENQQYFNASMEWIRAKLRRESGAAIGVDEAKNEFETYFPMPGDKPGKRKQLALLRKQVMDSLEVEGGRAVARLLKKKQEAALKQNQESSDGDLNMSEQEEVEAANYIKKFKEQYGG